MLVSPVLPALRRRHRTALGCEQAALLHLRHLHSTCACWRFEWLRRGLRRRRTRPRRPEEGFFRARHIAVTRATSCCCANRWTALHCHDQAASPNNDARRPGQSSPVTFHTAGSACGHRSLSPVRVDDVAFAAIRHRTHTGHLRTRLRRLIPCHLCTTWLHEERCSRSQWAISVSTPPQISVREHKCHLLRPISAYGTFVNNRAKY